MFLPRLLAMCYYTGIYTAIVNYWKIIVQWSLKQTTFEREITRILKHFVKTEAVKVRFCLDPG